MADRTAADTVKAVLRRVRWWHIMLAPVTLPGVVLFLPDVLVRMAWSHLLRRNARLHPGAAARVEPQAVVLFEGDTVVDTIAFADIRRVQWMLAERVAEGSVDDEYLLRLETSGDRRVVLVDTPAGLTHLLRQRGLVPRFAAGKWAEWLAVAGWISLLYFGFVRHIDFEAVVDWLSHRLGIDM